MSVLLIAILAAGAFVLAYFTYGRWLGRRVFELDPSRPTPAHTHRDGHDFVPTKPSIVFGHHFTSIAGTGPIVGPAIAVMWGWLPALLWVVIGSIFIGAVHDFGALVVSLRNKGQTVGQIAGKVINGRVRFLFLLVLFLALTIVLAIFGLVVAAVFRQYPEAITPCLIQIPLAIAIGVWLHGKGMDLKLPSLVALLIMYVTVIYGDVGVLGAFNDWAASWPVIVWVAILLAYSAIASVLPVWMLLQPRDYINSLQLLSALALIVVGLAVAAFAGGAPPVEGAERQPLAIVAPVVDMQPAGAPLLFPFLFITIACGAISGFHCLVSSGTSSKQLENESHARFIGYGSMLTEGFLATLVIL
ncbi:MAG: carbon starvation CstA family protein, partial [Planctomycetota bacterium]